MGRLALFLALVAVVAAAGWLVFVPRWPAPSGPHAVAHIELTLRDSRGQPISTTIWYPTTGAPREAAAGGTAPLETATPAPLILYSPGWGGTRTQSSVQTANLASHGFVVVGCDDYASDPALDPDHGVAIDLSSDAAMAATLQRGGRHAAFQANRLIAVLDAVQAGQAALLSGRVDMARVGVLGYSVGGSAGLQAALADARIVAVLNVDGALLGSSTTEAGTQAYFLLSSTEALPSQAELASQDASTRNYALWSAQDLPRNTRRMERPGNYWALIEGADHEDLSDRLFAVSTSKLWRTNFARSLMNDAIESYEVAFFRSALLGDSAPLAGLRIRPSHNVRWISSTSPSPGAAKAPQ